MPSASQPLQSEPPKQFELAEAPFDDAQADLILRSSDEVPVHFRVFKIILSLASPIFADMFSIPSPSPPSEKPHEEVQVVPLSEHSTALDIALRHIYPVRSALPPKADPLHYASILAEFARKYQVETLDQFIVGYLTDSLERDPVGVYTIAVTYGYSDTGANAARSCLNLPFSDLESPYLRYATAEHTLELLKYHVACGEAASTFASFDRSWIPSPAKLENGLFDRHRGSKTIYICQTCSALDFNSINERRSGPLCLWNYLHRSSLALAHYPAPEAVTGRDFVLTSNDCQSCPHYVRVYMLQLSVAFGEKVKKAVEQVPLPKAVSLGLSGANTTSN